MAVQLLLGAQRREGAHLCALWQGHRSEGIVEVRGLLDWVIVKMFSVLASVIIPDPTDGVWDEYYEGDRSQSPSSSDGTTSVAYERGEK